MTFPPFITIDKKLDSNFLNQKTSNETIVLKTFPLISKYHTYNLEITQKHKLQIIGIIQSKKAAFKVHKLQ